MRRVAGRAVATAVGVWALACGDESAVAAAKTADASAGSEVAIGTDASAAAIAEPTLTGPGHQDGPYVELTGTWSAESQRVVVTVWAGDLPNLLGMASHLTWDPAQLELTASQALDLTEESEATGFAWRHVLKPLAAGRLTAGTARFRTLSHPYAYPEGAKVGRSAWLKLEFLVKSAGKLTIAFDPATQLARKAEGELLPVQWVGATVEVPAGFAIGGAP